MSEAVAAPLGAPSILSFGTGAYRANLQEKHEEHLEKLREVVRSKAKQKQDYAQESFFFTCAAVSKAASTLAQRSVKSEEKKLDLEVKGLISDVEYLTKHNCVPSVLKNLQKDLKARRIELQAGYAAFASNYKNLDDIFAPLQDFLDTTTEKSIQKSIKSIMDSVRGLQKANAMAYDIFSSHETILLGIEHEIDVKLDDKSSEPGIALSSADFPTKKAFWEAFNKKAGIV